MVLPFIHARRGIFGGRIKSNLKEIYERFIREPMTAFTGSDVVPVEPVELRCCMMANTLTIDKLQAVTQGENG